MAVNVIAFNVGIQQNRNAFSKSYSAWFVKPWYPKALSLNGLVRRVAFDQSVYSNDIVKGVIERLTTTMVELLKSGQPVKWDGLGTFRPTITNANGGLSEEVVKAGGYNIGDIIEGVNICFIPENSKGEELTSRKFKDLCTFNNVGVIETKKASEYDETDTSNQYFQKIIPMETWHRDHPAPQP